MRPVQPPADRIADQIDSRVLWPPRPTLLATYVPARPFAHHDPFAAGDVVALANGVRFLKRAMPHGEVREYGLVLAEAVALCDEPVLVNWEPDKIVTPSDLIQMITCPEPWCISWYELHQKRIRSYDWASDSVSFSQIDPYQPLCSAGSCNPSMAPSGLGLTAWKGTAFTVLRDHLPQLDNQDRMLDYRIHTLLSTAGFAPHRHRDLVHHHYTCRAAIPSGVYPGAARLGLPSLDDESPSSRVSFLFPPTV